MSNESHPFEVLFVWKTLICALSLNFILLTSYGQQQQSNIIRELPPGETLVREMSGAESHRYGFDLQKDDFFHVKVDQAGIDVTLKLMDADGHVLATMDSPNGNEGSETLSFIAKKSANFVLYVGSTDERAKKGSYSVWRWPSRTATPQDARRVELERVFDDALQQMNTKDAILRTELIAKLQDVRRDWEEIHERYLVALTSQVIERLQRTQRAESDNQVLAEAVRVAIAVPVDKPITRALADEDGYHAYKATLPAGGVLRIKLREMGVNVFVTASRNENPFPKQPLIWSNFSVGFGRETATLVASESGEYVVLLSAIRGLPMRGTYELIGQVSPAGTDNDRKRFAAEKLNRESIPLSNAGTIDGTKSAISKYEQALAIWKELDESWFAADMEERIGTAYLRLGERQTALDRYQRALVLWNQNGDKYGKGTTLTSIGGLYSVLRDKQQALSYYQQGLSLARELGDKRGEADALGAIGDIYSSLGETRKALDYYRQALPLREASRDVRAEATSFSGLGITYSRLGEYQKALDNLEQSLTLAQLFNDARGKAIALNSLGAVYSNLKNRPRALYYFGQSLSLQRELRNKNGEAVTLNNMGQIYAELHETAKALESLDQAVILFRSVPNRSGEATSLGNLGELYLASGDKEKSFESFRSALPLMIAADNKLGEMEILGNLMKFYRSQNLVGPSVFYGKLAVGKLQARRETIQDLDPQVQQSFVRRFQDNYQQLAEILIQDDQLAQAVQIINLYRDQQMFDFSHDPTEYEKGVAESERETSYSGRYQKAVEEIKRNADLIEQFKLRIGARKPSDAEAKEQNQLREDLKKASDALLTFLEEIPSAFPKTRDARDKVQSSVEVTEMQHALRQVSSSTKKNVVAIYTLSGETSLSILLVSPHEIKAYSSSIKREEFRQKILDFYAVLQAPKYDPRPLGKQLYDLIVKPVEAELRQIGAKTIVWGLDGNLRYVPMAALSPDGETYLIDQYETVEFTRSNPERMTRANSVRWIGTGFGSGKPRSIDLFKDGDTTELGPLPGATAWLQSNKGLINGELFLDERFTENQFYRALAQHPQLVHVASHFVFRPGDDTRSFLLLGDGKPLTLGALKGHQGLFAGVEMLTLAACDTAATQPDANGREIDGFAELAQRLGASSVMGSLWEVTEASTHRLMRNFYVTRQQKSGITKAGALRTAQLALLKGPAISSTSNVQMGGATPHFKVVIVPDASKHKSDLNGTVYISARHAPPFKQDYKKPFAHPYYWAPFILVGNWK
jgi:CHAT domain-containing protein/Tfp pilus assembly protein PilF